MSYIFKINTLDLNVLSTGKSTFYASCEVCRAVLKLMVIFCTKCTANICHTTLCTSTAYAVLASICPAGWLAATVVYRVKLAKDTAIVATECE